MSNFKKPIIDKSNKISDDIIVLKDGTMKKVKKKKLSPFRINENSNIINPKYDNNKLDKKEEYDVCHLKELKD